MDRFIDWCINNIIVLIRIIFWKNFWNFFFFIFWMIGEVLLCDFVVGILFVYFDISVNIVVLYSIDVMWESIGSVGIILVFW